MSETPYPAPLACVDPSLGAHATQALGKPASGAVAAHLAICTACRLQRLAFADPGTPPVPPTPEVRARLRSLWGAGMAQRNR